MEEIIEQSGVESVPAAEGQTEVQTEVAPDTSSTPDGTTEPQGQNNFEKAFAKRLSAEREKWQQEVGDKYKHYDAYERAAKYLQKQNGIDDPLTLKEQIEMAELQEQAEKQNVPVDVLQRLNQLEQRDAKLKEYERQQELQQFYQQHRTQLDAFAKERGIEAQTLEDYMIENNVNNMQIAYKAMRADQLEQELSSVAKKTEADTIKKIQQNAATTPGSVSQGGDNAPINFAALPKDRQREIIAKVQRGEIRSLNDI